MNDFNKFGRTFQVRVQADAPFRAHAEDIGLLKARNDKGEMVPLSSAEDDAKLRPRPGSAPTPSPRPTSTAARRPARTGQAQAVVERIAAETPPRGISYEWTEITYQDKIAGNTLFIILPLSILLVFFVLAAQYESLDLAAGCA